jgi:ATP synthase protein I
MTKILPGSLVDIPDGQDHFDGEQEEVFEPLTAHQAAVWRSEQRPVAAKSLLAWQCIVVAALGALTAAWTGETQAKSLIYGGVAVIAPAALMVWGLRGGLMRRLSVHPAGSLIGFALLEGGKLMLSVLLMLSAPQAVDNLSWLALLAGVVVALKVHWLVVGFHAIRAKRVV